MHLRESYLSRMGIQQWIPRAQNNFYFLIFLHQCLTPVNKLSEKQFTGYLLLETENECFQLESRIGQLVGAMVKAMGFELGSVISWDPLTLEENVDFFIMMGQQQNQFLKPIPPNAKKLILFSPSQLLASPILKKEVWKKLRNFT